MGTVCIRKGIPYLLEAWKKANRPGTLVIAGGIDKALLPFLEPYRNDPSIEFEQYVSDPSLLYSRADYFVLPTLEEGAPQVVYEAAGAGLPVITTPMGKGRMIEDGVNGLVVNPGDVDGLAAAIVSLSQNAELRDRLGNRALSDASRFAYPQLGAQRALIMAGLLG